MKSWLVFPLSSTGNNRRIELVGTDIANLYPVNNVFVYPSDLNIDRLNEALGRTLSLWPLIAGRFLLLDDENYVIEMSDNAIPVSLIDNTELSKWPLGCSVLRDIAEGLLPAFFDEVQTVKLVCYPSHEPLFRLKVTHIMQSNEWVMGTSWSHILGDACAYANFLHAFSRFYQQLEPLEPVPVFERRLWRKEEADPSLLPMMRHLTDTISAEQRLTVHKTRQVTHDQLNLHFSGKQLATLRELVLDNTLTIHDVLLAYIIVTLNIHCFSNDGQLILHTSILVNCRGVSDSIAPSNLVANCVIRTLSDNFDDPYSLSNIAKLIRRSIIRSRDPKFLERYQSTEDGLLKDMVRDDRESGNDHFSSGILINSNFRYDWASLVDFGHTDKCRFYTEGARFVRVFRLNPMYDATGWAGRDCEGAEVVFRIEKSIKQKFLDALQHDVNENFINVKR
jgi:hypothetical protein